MATQPDGIAVMGHPGDDAFKPLIDDAIAQGIAVTSYQGGHVEYLKYMHDLVREAGCDIRIFAGGGGTILPAERSRPRLVSILEGRWRLSTRSPSGERVAAPRASIR